MRQRYVVTYDISDPKRLRKVFSIMRGFGDAMQLSVFRCDLSRTEKVMLIERLTNVINHNHDQVLFVDLGPVGGRADVAIDFLGRVHDNPVRKAVIV